MTARGGTSWTELLDPLACWQLVQSTDVGRLGVLVDSAPEIYPVNHVVDIDTDTVLFRTLEGTKLRAMERSPSVCFQVDHIEPGKTIGWSVLLKGRAVEVVAPDEIRAAERLAASRLALRDPAHWIRIVTSEITGRRLDWSGIRTPS